jgi:AraC-like DNA-binding protein
MSERARTIVRTSPGGNWESVVREPSEPLRRYAHAYEGYAFAASEGVARHVPPPYVPLILGFSGVMRMEGGRIGGEARHQAFVAGMHDRWVDSTTDGASAGVQVNLTPIGAYTLLGLPMYELSGRVADVRDVFGAEGRDLSERLADASDWDARMDIVDALLEQRLLRARPASPAIDWAWKRLAATGGNAPIAGLAERIGWSRKHFASQFREHIGLTPKMAGRVLRFNHVLGTANRGAEMSWASIAMTCGYYDQAHLIRDFNEFAGAPPLEYMSRQRLHGEYAFD